MIKIFAIVQTFFLSSPLDVQYKSFVTYEDCVKWRRQEMFMPVNNPNIVSIEISCTSTEMRDI